jgi:light-regulated signal transduction histidine kinase (bacteriophytochrome)
MGLLIDDLLHYSRTGRAEMLKVVVDTETLVKDVINELTEYEPERHINWQVEPLPDVYADQSLLRIVWMNILGNAMKFTSKQKESPVISIGSLPDDKGEAIYFVRDNGAGFNMKYCAKAFGVFQRLHSENEFKGTGIGLATVQKIIQRHGGNVWAEAEVGRGAVFYFTVGGRET